MEAADLARLAIGVVGAAMSSAAGAVGAGAGGLVADLVRSRMSSTERGRATLAGLVAAPADPAARQAAAEALQAEIEADPDLRQQLRIHLSHSRSQNTGSVVIAGSTVSRSQISLGPITVNNTRSGRLVLALAGALVLALLALLTYGGVRFFSSGDLPGSTAPGGTGTS